MQTLLVSVTAGESFIHPADIIPALPHVQPQTLVDVAAMQNYILTRVDENRMSA